MDAQNFNFASKFPESWIFIPKFCIFAQKFSGKQKIFGQTNIYTTVDIVLDMGSNRQ